MMNQQGLLVKVVLVGAVVVVVVAGDPVAKVVLRHCPGSRLDKKGRNRSHRMFALAAAACVPPTGQTPAHLAGQCHVEVCPR